MSPALLFPGASICPTPIISHELTSKDKDFCLLALPSNTQSRTFSGHSRASPSWWLTWPPRARER